MSVAPAPVVAYRSAAEHLADELSWLDLMLARHVAWLRATGQFNEDPLRGLYISDAEVSSRLQTVSEPAGDYDLRIGSKRAVIDARLADSVGLPIPMIASRFGLNEFERACLLMATAAAIDPRYEVLFAYAHNDVSRKAPSVGLALALLAEGPTHRLSLLQSFSPHSKLLRSDLIHFSATELSRPLVGRGMCIDERVVFALLGQGCGGDERVAAFIARLDETLVPWRDGALVERAVAALQHHNHGVALLLEGPADCGQRQLAMAACSAADMGLIAADLSSPGASSIPERELGRLLAREAMLEGSALLMTVRDLALDLRHDSTVSAAVRAGASVFVAASPGTISATELASSLPVVDIAMPAVTADIRGGWWRAALAKQGHDREPGLPLRLGLSLRCGPDAVERTVSALDPEKPLRFRTLAGIARRATRAEVPALARLVRHNWQWDDLVLPEKQVTRLRQICCELEYAPRVLHDWNFAGKTGTGFNNIVLFSGASGTGKSMAAAVIASTIGLDLYRIDLSTMVDKYIGETEKNLERTFAAMEATNAAIFFDECDVLFSKRSEVKDAHDRYANLSVAYLLQRIESYEGVIVLATNLSGNMDEAFSRRLNHVVHFPLPDTAMREKLWVKAFPIEAPIATDLDLQALARNFELTGGNIRNAALASAYLAAARNEAIGQRHVLQAIAIELEKIGRPPIESDFGDSYSLLAVPDA
ncbi:ATP-binding protein [Rhizobium cauense]|uniref:ATP-binding protein n=1 Tax=Rhizobium cauense TaxID=1166683 RepID=UPI001C6F06C3|nr:ATP-binding protein [Rhizobium cauense]MBW9114633.1 ATP-binding protein [Rhizobium cauense]